MDFYQNLKNRFRIIERTPNVFQFLWSDYKTFCFEKIENRKCLFKGICQQVQRIVLEYLMFYRKVFWAVKLINDGSCKHSLIHWALNLKKVQLREATAIKINNFWKKKFKWSCEKWESNISKDVDFSIWDNFSTTHTHISLPQK